MSCPTLTPKLVIPSQPAFLPAATALTEHAVRAFGFDESVALPLVLATEEVFSGLTKEPLPITLEVRDGLYYAELAFSFPTATLPVKQLNMTSVVEVGAEEDFEQVNWLVAARTVDRFAIEHASNRTTHLRLRKNRDYPVASGEVSWPSAESRVHEVRPPEAQELTLFAERVARMTQESLLVDFFRKPGKLVDMVASGDLEALVAVSRTNDPLGGLILDRRNQKTALMHGPFLFDQPQELARKLFHEALNSLARTSVEGVVTEQLDSLLPTAEMEVLGHRTFRLDDGIEHRVTTFYRHLREDEGCTVWAAPWLEPFLLEQYDRLDLPREVQAWRQTGSLKESHSVLSCDFRKTRSEVIVRPVLPGRDARANLSEHLRVLDGGVYRNVSFHLDLGHPSEMAFAEALREEGFRPVLVEPSGGRGDLLVLELQEASS